CTGDDFFVLAWPNLFSDWQTRWAGLWQQPPFSTVPPNVPHENVISPIMEDVPQEDTNQKKCGRHSWLPHGFGVFGSANAEAGASTGDPMQKAGFSGGLAGGAGVFYGSGSGLSTGTFTSYVATAYAGHSTVGIPQQASTPVVGGASLGAGWGYFATNAQSVA